MSQGIPQMMRDPDLSGHDVILVSGTSIGFAIGVASLLVIIFSTSIAVAYCYYRDKVRSRRRSSNEPDIEQPPLRPEATGKDVKYRHGESVPVLMPGDHVPKFIALPCPCEPLREEEKVVEMQKVLQ